MREVNPEDLEVKCPNEGAGCTWKGKLDVVGAPIPWVGLEPLYFYGYVMVECTWISTLQNAIF